MSAFSWKTALLTANENILRQAKTKAKLGDQQAKLDHPDEVRDANGGNYTKLTLRIKQELETKRKIVNERRERIGIGQT